MATVAVSSGSCPTRRLESPTTLGEETEPGASMEGGDLSLIELVQKTCQALKRSERTLAQTNIQLAQTSIQLAQAEKERNDFWAVCQTGMRQQRNLEERLQSTDQRLEETAKKVEELRQENVGLKQSVENILRQNQQLTEENVCKYNL